MLLGKLWKHRRYGQANLALMPLSSSVRPEAPE